MSHAIRATAVATSALPASEAMDGIIADPLPLMFTKWGPFPAVVRAELVSGEEWAVGAKRIVFTSDGNKMTEQFIRRDAGANFAYRLSALEGIFGWLVEGIDDVWNFTAAPAGSHVVWTWYLDAKPGRRFPLWLLTRAWQVYMGKILRPTLKRLEASAR